MRRFKFVLRRRVGDPVVLVVGDLVVWNFRVLGLDCFPVRGASAAPQIDMVVDQGCEGNCCPCEIFKKRRG